MRLTIDCQHNGLCAVHKALVWRRLAACFKNPILDADSPELTKVGEEQWDRVRELGLLLALSCRTVERGPRSFDSPVIVVHPVFEPEGQNWFEENTLCSSIQTIWPHRRVVVVQVVAEMLYD